MYLHKHFRKVRLKRKINWEKKANSNNNDNKPNLFFQMIFHKYLHGSISKICLASTIHLRYGIMLFNMCHFLVKAVAFFELKQCVLKQLLKQCIFLSFLLFGFQLWDYLYFWTFFLGTYRKLMTWDIKGSEI